MSSSFKGHDLFGSGPHRFTVGKQGPFVFSTSALGSPSADSLWSGIVEMDVTVKGRLIASSESALWSARDAVVAQLLDPPTRGDLVDARGHTWTNMSLISYVEGDRTDRGRDVSIAYTAVFRRFNQSPG